MMARVLSLGLFAALPQLGSANAFLKNSHALVEERVSEEVVRTSLLSEIMGVFGSDATVGRLAEMESILKPMFAALPKNERGNVGHSTVRYAMHRLFVQRHGWFVKGLDRAGGSWNDTSPAGILKDRVPQYIQGLFEKRLGDQGLNLHEMAVFASTLEHLVHDEAKARLNAAFKIYSLPTVGKSRFGDVAKALDTYMQAYIVGGNVSNMTFQEVKAYYGDVREIYPFWNETQLYMRDVQQQVVRAELGRDSVNDDDEVDFEVVLHMVDKIGEGYGRFQDKECQTLKLDLVRLEDRGSGRVRLADFYQAALSGESWQFSESSDYLRQLGVLDESDAGDPRVILANYVGSHSNCVVSSSFYSVCCMDECEGLMGHLESRIAAPEATPDLIGAVVGQLSSSTVAAPRSLPPALLQRLEEIGASHGGYVPIHGRLFAQWMHHAFPRECMYPHASGTTKPKSQEEWMQEMGEEALVASEEEMRRFARLQKSTPEGSDANVTDAGSECDMMWTTEEELLIVRPDAPTGAGSAAMSFARKLAFIVAVGLAAHGSMRSMGSALGHGRKGDSDKYYV